MWRSRRSSRIASIRIISPSALELVEVRDGRARVVPSSSRANARASVPLADPGRARGRGTRAPGPRRAPPRAGASPRAARAAVFASSSRTSSAISSTGSAPRRAATHRSGNSGHDLPVAVVERAARTRRPRARSGRGAPLVPRRATSSGSRSSTNVCSGSRPPVTGRVQLEHGVDAEPARDALVGERRVDVAVADDRRAALERRPDHPLDELGARRREQRRLGPRRSSRARRAAARGSARRAAFRPARAAGATSRPSPRSHSASSAAWVVLPEPSIPSNVTNTLAYDTSMRAVVTGGAGFIGSHLVDALVARGDEVIVVDDLSSGKREHVNAGGDVRRARHPRRASTSAGADVVFHLAAQADVQTSVQRPDHDAEVNVVGTVQVLEAARAAGAQVVFTSTGGAIYGECDGAGDRGRAAAAGLARTGSRSSAARSTCSAGTGSTGSSTSCSGSGTSTGRGRTPSLEGGVVSIFLERMAPRRADDDLRRRPAGARLRLRRRRRRGAARGGGPRAAASSTSARGDADDRARPAPRVRARSPGATPSRASSRRGSATCAARCSTSRAPRPSSAGAPDGRSTTASRRTWDWMARCGSGRSPAAARRNRAGPWTRRSHPHELVRPVAQGH